MIPRYWATHSGDINNSGQSDDKKCTKIKKNN